MNFTDPSGHICVEDDGGSDVGMPGNCGGGSNPKYKRGFQGPSWQRGVKMKKKKINNGNKSQGIEFDETISRKIYTPAIVGILFFPIAVMIGYFSENKSLAQIVLGLGVIIMGLSGIFCIKFRVVPGIPTYRGAAALVFGIWYMLLFTGGGIVLILAVFFNW
jgi:hypothetical protein